MVRHRLTRRLRPLGSTRVPRVPGRSRAWPRVVLMAAPKRHVRRTPPARRCLQLSKAGLATQGRIRALTEQAHSVCPYPLRSFPAAYYFDCVSATPSLCSSASCRAPRVCCRDLGPVGWGLNPGTWTRLHCASACFVARQRCGASLPVLSSASEAFGVSFRRSPGRPKQLVQPIQVFPLDTSRSSCASTSRGDARAHSHRPAPRAHHVARGSTVCTIPHVGSAAGVVWGGMKWSVHSVGHLGRARSCVIAIVCLVRHPPTCYKRPESSFPVM